MAGSSAGDAEEAKIKEWLIEITKTSKPEASSKLQMGTVPNIVRQIDSACFDPLVVSFGAYHHRKVALEPMNRYKNDAARWFFDSVSSASNSDDKMKIYYDFVTIASQSLPFKAWYVADDTKELNEEVLARMMFLDGCFILYFINLVMEKPDDLMKNAHLSLPMIVRDMFLLENQVPYVVLKALMNLMRDQGRSNQSDVVQRTDIEKFIKEMFLPRCESLESLTSRFNSLVSTSWQLGGRSNDHKIDASNSMESNDNHDPLHLLDFLRKMFIGGPVTLSGKPCKYYFRSIIELKTAGIKLCRSHSSHLQEIKFEKSFFSGHLFLPQMIVDDTTKTWLLNLIAYEMCPERPPDSISEITSYICFLDSLIDHAEDVKELRSKDILLNRLGSDEEVAKLFNELANNLMPHPRLFSDTMKEIESHCKNHFMVWFAQMLQTHFSSPWTVISLLAMIFLLVLTVVQTIFTVWPRNGS